MSKPTLMSPQPAQLLPSAQQDAAGNEMDSNAYRGKPKQQTRPIFIILGALAVVSVFWFLLKPSATPPIPVVSKVRFSRVESRQIQ